MNFAYLTSFQAIEFMDWPVPKTQFLYVRQVKTKLSHSVTVVRPLFAVTNENTIISSPVSTFSARTPSTMTTITTWEEMKVRVRRIRWEIRLKDDN